MLMMVSVAHAHDRPTSIVQYDEAVVVFRHNIYSL